MIKKMNFFVIIYDFIIKVRSVVVFDNDILANTTLIWRKYQGNIKLKTNKIHFELIMNARLRFAWSCDSEIPIPPATVSCDSNGH